MFRRDKKGQKGLEKNPSRSKRDNRSVLDADSFIFMPGGTESQYWGEIMKDENFPFSHLGEMESRRKTHIGLVQSQETNGLQEVNLIISPDVQELEKDGNFILNGKVFNRRLSGTLVKAKSTDFMDDEPVIRDYAFLLSARERLSQELSGRYVYDRLIRPPLQSKNTYTQQKQQQQQQQQSSARWNYPGKAGGENKSPLLTDRRKKANKDEVVLRRTGPATSTPIRDSNLLGVNRGQLTCNVRDTTAQNRKGQNSLKRPLSGLTVDSGYSNLEFSHSVVGSEYALPFDAINWEGKEMGIATVCMPRLPALPSAPCMTLQSAAVLS